MGNPDLQVLPRAPVQELYLKIGERHAVDYYGGPYEVTPRRAEQVLATEALTMREDVVVHEIPYYETTNPSGKTFVIGE